MFGWWISVSAKNFFFWVILLFFFFFWSVAWQIPFNQFLWLLLSLNLLKSIVISTLHLVSLINPVPNNSSLIRTVFKTSNCFWMTSEPSITAYIILSNPVQSSIGFCKIIWMSYFILMLFPKILHTKKWLFTSNRKLPGYMLLFVEGKGWDPDLGALREMKQQ